ncbi:hypothetical protein GCM10011391_08480 [Pullulanibacillus camelliae]|uniref:HTH psq-type domain-containing protein n=1 Tax=Pullulanibacillus camelliae TaxID=1707096 RepID=A0A8J2YFW9_9BACL|nr:SEC-C metal-binding domain-containing protein [Pullulanibacillus camelliae]GGE32144.1 hypothetical protein GCM10011391_08480 [Pullulanibacillus camelliae]
MKKIGRNDPCPCGSGKKYKKCCMNKLESVEKEQEKILFQEYERVLVDIFNYAQTKYEDELSQPLNDFFQTINVDDKFVEDQTIFLIIWQLFNQPVGPKQQPVFSYYLDKYKSTQTRPSAIQMVESWKHTTHSVYRVKDIHTDQHYAVLEDVWTKQTFKTLTQEKQFNPAYLIIGQLIDIGPIKELFGGYYELEEYTDSDLTNIQSQYFPSGKPEDVQKAFREQFPQILHTLVTKDAQEDSPESFYKAFVESGVGAIFIEKCGALIEEKVKETVLNIWQAFNEKEVHIVRRPNLYAAALEYLAANLSEQYAITQAELSRKYDVSASSISQKYRDIKAFSETMIMA